MSNPTLTLPERLRRARLLAGLEQAQLAAAMGVARTSISNYECGRTSPSAHTFVHWAQATGTPLEWLAEGVPAIPEAREQQLELPLEVGA